jgi:hypothetical protein
MNDPKGNPIRMAISLVIETDEDDWPEVPNLPQNVAGYVTEELESVRDLIRVESATGVEIAKSYGSSIRPMTDPYKKPQDQSEIEAHRE